ncbi:MAG: toxin-antitoxin system YwqK family antitoxin [Flavobacteriales bacterium]
MIFRILFLLLISANAFAQTDNMVRKVMRKHENGKDYVVLYFDKESDEMLKEEVFFPNGKLQWTGTYKKNLENGTWKFYFESGKLKSEETYLNGKEHGTSKEFNESGQKIKESYWKHGKLIKELKF